MLGSTSVERVYLACGTTDLRKSIDGLAVIVQECFILDPFSPSLFVFTNRILDELRILYCENSGFWLYYKRLEQGVFHWPSGNNGTSMHVSHRQLRWLLDGLALEQRKAHRAVPARTVL